MKSVLLASLLLIFSHLSVAEKQAFPAIDGLMKTHINTAQIGIWIQDADSKAVLYSRSGEVGFTPASLTKSYTTAASLLDLPTDFTYQTTLTYDKSQLQGDVLRGDLALVFSGDPSFTTQDLESLLRNITTVGIKTIQGNIIIDNTDFPKPYEGRGLVGTDLNWYFGTPVKSVMIDENQIPITITPSTSLGQKVTVALNGNIDVPISNQVTTVTKEESDTLCQLNVELDPEDNGIYLYGCWPAQKDRQATGLKVALANPELRVEQIISLHLKQQGITLNGTMLTKRALLPDILASHSSGSLSTLNAINMQRSNNLYADSLTKVLGKKNYQRGTLQAGSYAILNILEKKLGLNVQKIRLFDGSGQSIYNQITPHSTALLLQAMYDQKELRQDYLNTMEVLGPEHTFYSRLPKNLTQSLYIKTGSMTGVSNMAGYLKTKNGRTLIFVCLLNQLPLDKTGARLFEQKFIEELMGDNRKTS